MQQSMGASTTCDVSRMTEMAVCTTDGFPDVKNRLEDIGLCILAELSLRGRASAMVRYSTGSSFGGNQRAKPDGLHRLCYTATWDEMKNPRQESHSRSGVPLSPFSYQVWRAYTKTSWSLTAQDGRRFATELKARTKGARWTL